VPRAGLQKGSTVRLYVVWPWTAGLTCIIVGLFVARRDLVSARYLDKLVVLGPVFVGASLAAFSAEHFVLAPFIQNSIPTWMPGRLFLAYVVGVALLAAAASFVLGRYLWVASSLLALMFVIFVATMHVPNALRAADRFPWIVALRDLSFAGGAMALAGVSGVGRRADGASWLATLGRVIVAAACIVFGVVHFVYPANVPGVPLQKLMPAWIPVPALWAYLTGAIEVVLGGLILAGRRTRAAATWLGLAVTVLVLVIYVPVVSVAVEGGEKLEALNYVWDTLLFAGTVLLVARTEPGQS
jgi:uncharacterized membrane protein YphA (DoxX/SURF4 family)